MEIPDDEGNDFTIMHFTYSAGRGMESIWSNRWWDTQEDTPTTPPFIRYECGEFVLYTRNGGKSNIPALRTPGFARYIYSKIFWFVGPVTRIWDDANDNRAIYINIIESALRECYKRISALRDRLI